MVSLRRRNKKTAAEVHADADGQYRLNIEDVSKTFIDPKGREVNALSHFSYDAHGAQIISIVGPSGCGKSTLLRLIAGLDTADTGQLTLNDQPIDRPNYMRCLVVQDAALYDWLTVYENIAFGLRARKVFEGNELKVDEYIKMMGLEGFEHSYPYQLSGGMAARVALARTFIEEPGVVLLDEPLSALDAFTRATLQDEIVKMHLNSNALFLLVTHDIEEAVYLSDKILILSPRPGRLVGQVDVDIPHPRNRLALEFVEKRAETLKYFETTT